MQEFDFCDLRQFQIDIYVKSGHIYIIIVIENCSG